MYNRRFIDLLIRCMICLFLLCLYSNILCVLSPKFVSLKYRTDRIFKYILLFFEKTKLFESFTETELWMYYCRSLNRLFKCETNTIRNNIMDLTLLTSVLSRTLEDTYSMIFLFLREILSCTVAYQMWPTLSGYIEMMIPDSFMIPFRDWCTSMNRNDLSVPELEVDDINTPDIEFINTNLDNSSSKLQLDHCTKDESQSNRDTLCTEFHVFDSTFGVIPHEVSQRWKELQEEKDIESFHSKSIKRIFPPPRNSSQNLQTLQNE